MTDDKNNHYITGMKELKPGDLGYESPCSSSNSHAVLAAEIARLREKNKKLREVLALTKVAKGQSPRNFDAFVDKKLEELKED